MDSLMQRRITLLRHGHAEEHPDDFARTLSEVGRAGADEAGEALARAGWLPQHVLASAAPRARLTAELAARAAGFSGSIELDRELYLASDARCLMALRRLPDQTTSVWLVGHNPGLSRLAAELSGHACELAPAQYVSVVLELERWSDL
jgi:phosphohistidine phosphatase